MLKNNQVCQFAKFLISRTSRTDVHDLSRPECTYLPTLSCLRLYSFWASLPHSLTIWDIVSFLALHIQQRGYSPVLFVNILLEKVSSYRLFLGTSFQSLGASFQITFFSSISMCCSYPCPLYL